MRCKRQDGTAGEGGWWAEFPFLVALVCSVRIGCGGTIQCKPLTSKKIERMNCPSHRAVQAGSDGGTLFFRTWIMNRCYTATSPLGKALGWLGGTSKSRKQRCNNSVYAQLSTTFLSQRQLVQVTNAQRGISSSKRL